MALDIFTHPLPPPPPHPHPHTYTQTQTIKKLPMALWPCPICEKKLFIVSMVSGSVFKVSPFSLILILSLMRDLSENKGFTNFQNTETATRCVLCKKEFLEISQNSRENTCARVSFLIKLQASCNFL